ncbi:hypothetical protein ABE494_15725 [Stenotrophomonas lactitubi]|uniref:hypothetical protein n=1 Tax=Stenotrophomonas lactitubi TaxID=2045214 RepID=UPI003209AA51
MKSLIYALAVLAALLGVAFADSCLPKTGLELRTYQKVSDAELAFMRQEAARPWSEGGALSAGKSGEMFFELSCQGEPVVLVDNF